jgi:5-methylcytosine-specific restriction endonuclease McrA
MLTQEYLYQRYVVDGLSVRQIAKEANASDVLYWMRKHDIPRRTKSEALSGEKNPMCGKHHSSETRARIRETTKQVFSDPLVRAQRSTLTKGVRNPMYGRTHSATAVASIIEKNRAYHANLERSADARQAHREAMARPSVRRKIADSAKQRIGARNPFFGKHHTTETLLKLSQANQGRFQGSRGSNWRGGKTKLSQLIRNSEPAIRWRRSVFERDAYTCRLCGKVGGRLHADHIRPLSVLLDENNVRSVASAYACTALWDISNGRTLCVPCHKNTPTYAGKLQKGKLQVPRCK